MTGIMAAIGGSSKRIVLANGLYLTGVGADPVPISASANSFNGQVVYNYSWIGYYVPNTSASVTFSVTAPYTEYYYYQGGTVQYNWSGGGYSTSYVWIGDKAINNATAGNADLTASDSTGSYSTALNPGGYYPFRINWSTVLPNQDYETVIYYATSSVSLTVAGGSGSGLLFYNSATNGF